MPIGATCLAYPNLSKLEERPFRQWSQEVAIADQAKRDSDHHEEAPLPGDRGQPHPGPGDIQFEPDGQLDMARRAAGRLGGGRFIRRCSNRSRGLWPKKRCAAVVPSARVTPWLWTTVSALSLRWVR